MSLSTWWRRRQEQKQLQGTQLYASSILWERLRDLGESEKALLTVEEHEVRDKIIACLLFPKERVQVLRPSTLAGAEGRTGHIFPPSPYRFLQLLRPGAFPPSIIIHLMKERGLAPCNAVDLADLQKILPLPKNPIQILALAGVRPASGESTMEGFRFAVLVNNHGAWQEDMHPAPRSQDGSARLPSKDWLFAAKLLREEDL